MNKYLQELIHAYELPFFRTNYEKYIYRGQEFLYTRSFDYPHPVIHFNSLQENKSEN